MCGGLFEEPTGAGFEVVIRAYIGDSDEPLEVVAPTTGSPRSPTSGCCHDCCYDRCLSCGVEGELGTGAAGTGAAGAGAGQSFV